MPPVIKSATIGAIIKMNTTGKMKINSGINILVEACAASFSALLSLLNLKSVEKFLSSSTKLVPNSSDCTINPTKERIS